MDTETKDNEVIVEAMISRAEKAEEPGTLKPGTVVEKGGGDTPPMVATTVTSAGYWWIYDTLTGDRSKANKNMLPSLLKLRRPDKSLLFTLDKPKHEPKRGSILCPLHKDTPEREKYDEMGLPTCIMATLPSKHQLVRHMQVKHKTAWEAIEHERLEKERQEDRDLNRAVLKQLVPDPPLYVSDKDRKKE